MIKKCAGCGSVLQCINEKEEGYVKSLVYERASYCERCFKITHYGEASVIDKKQEIDDFLDNIDVNIPALYLVDLTCVSKSMFEPLKRIKNKVYLILTKRDLIPKSVKDRKLISYIRENYNFVLDIFVISSKKKMGIDFLYDKLIRDKVSICYLLGFTNSGKSTLLNGLLNSKGKENVVTTSEIPNTTMEFIKIKIDDNLSIIDTPGFISENSLVNFINLEDYRKFLPKVEIKPKIYSLKPGFMLIIENFIRIENNSDEVSKLIFYLKNDLNYKKMKVVTSERLKELEKKDLVINNDEDVVIEGLGFIKVPSSSKLTFYVPRVSILSIRKKMI